MNGHWSGSVDRWYDIVGSPQGTCLASEGWIFANVNWRRMVVHLHVNEDLRTKTSIFILIEWKFSRRVNMGIKKCFSVRNASRLSRTLHELLKYLPCYFRQAVQFILAVSPVRNSWLVCDAVHNRRLLYPYYSKNIFYL